MITDEPMLPLISRIRTWWTNADRTQRTVTLGGIGALFLLLIGTTIFATRPHYEPLFSGLDETEKGQIVTALGTLGIPEQHNEPGVIKVPGEKREDAMIGLANAQKLPKESGHWDLDKYKDVSLGTSPEMEGQIIKAVLEGRVARIIEHSDGVGSATVLLNIPEQRVFAEQKERPTASVTIVEGGSGMLTRTQGRVIANLVCNAVAGMSPADVFVASNSLGVLWDGKEMNSNAGGTKSELDAKESANWEARIQAALDVPFGQNNTKVICRADLDMDKSVVDDNQVTPAEKPTVVSTASETMKGGKGGSTASGVGSDANMPTGGTTKAPSQPANGTGNTGSSEYVRSGQDKTYDSNHKLEHTEKATGDLRGLAITVIANSDKVTDPSAVQTIINGVLGGKIKYDAQGVALPDQAFTATVTAVKFDGSAAAAAKSAADAAAGQQRMQQIVSILPIGAILLVALLVARQVGKISKAVLPAPPAATEALAEGDSMMDALPMPELQDMDFDGEGMMPGTGLVRSNKPLLELPPELEEFRDRIDVPLESLKRIAGERPEMVATLIKSMMLGETL